MIQEFNGKKPNIHSDTFIAHSAQIIGDVEIKINASIWYNVVIRADVDKIIIGECSNIQDGCILHEDNNFPLLIGKNVIVGHNAILHGAKIGNGVLIGMGAIILDGAEIGDNSIIGAGTIISSNKKIESEVLVLGIPGKVIRKVTKEEIEKNLFWVQEYIKLAKKHKNLKK
ncbi:MAG: gamma carbonic anhydrase family protein [bacterium]